MSRTAGAKAWLRSHASIHRPDGRTPVFLCGIPRGGSTWIMEVLSTRPGTRMIAEPFNLRVPDISKALGTLAWSDMGRPEFTASAMEYLRSIESGRVRFLNPNPFVLRRFVTHRTLYKVIHLPVEYACTLAQSLGAMPLVLLRHPASVSLSRKIFPLLESAPACPLFEQLNAKQAEKVQRVLRDGSHLERGVAAWCLHYHTYLENCGLDPAPESLLTYEEMLLDPNGELLRIERLLGERFPQRVHSQLKRPSRVLSKSDPATQRVLSSKVEGEERTRYLLERWMERIDEEGCKRGQEILDLFGVTIYTLTSAIPHLTRINPPV